jgi:hypothetical protein
MVSSLRVFIDLVLSIRSLSLVMLQLSDSYRRRQLKMSVNRTSSSRSTMSTWRRTKKDQSTPAGGLAGSHSDV